MTNSSLSFIPKPLIGFHELGLFGLLGGRADYKGARAYASAQNRCNRKTMVKSVNLTPRAPFRTCYYLPQPNFRQQTFHAQGAAVSPIKPRSKYYARLFILRGMQPGFAEGESIHRTCE